MKEAVVNSISGTQDQEHKTQEKSKQLLETSILEPPIFVCNSGRFEQVLKSTDAFRKVQESSALKWHRNSKSLDTVVVQLLIAGNLFLLYFFFPTNFYAPFVSLALLRPKVLAFSAFPPSSKEAREKPIIVFTLVLQLLKK